ncbi:polysaccharide biosynthesis/export family protein [Pontibacter silvestris]|uniref:Polysaccharide biosynthesis/export family protein n=1 Tax=Pontibacter silvestris TaxID=2305183 RepID=A0ABW4WYS9_9BACT|nr:polysaccharide biosynthesis/export family protein [Pontibacter silvestris]MCC9137351.1 polysaccharide export protein [Pontibacter silvestris]
MWLRNITELKTLSVETPRMRYTLIAAWMLLGILLVSSCVPQKKLILLQNDPEVRNQGEADKLLKTFDLKPQVYTLKPGDVLSLRVQSTTPTEFNFLNTGTATFGAQDPVLDGYTLDAEGNMILPVIGKVNLANLTMPEARIKVTDALRPYLTDPTVNLRLLTFRYTVLGEVTRQGQFTTYQDNINVVEAIATAGGLTPYANRGRIKLLRSEGGQAKLYTFSLLDNNTVGQNNFFLQPNDMLVVDPLPARNIRENLLSSVALTLSVLSTITLLIERLTR